MGGELPGPSLSSIAEQLDSLTAATEALKAAVNEKRSKDTWDKAGVIAQFVSGVLIGAAGLAVTLIVHHAQLGISRTQVKIAEQTQAASYLRDVFIQTDDKTRAELIRTLDQAVPVEYAVRTAMYYARNSREGSPEAERPLYDASIHVLRSVAGSGRERLEMVRASGEMPDADIANAVLGNKIRVHVRVSQIDDYAHFVVGTRELITAVDGTADTGWVDITDKLTDGRNEFYYTLVNGPYGGFKNRLEISAGTWQYDSGLIARNSCPCNAPAFGITGAVIVSRTVSADGTATLVADSPVFYPIVPAPTSP
jgi:hypothetical protein